jgi:hypothetical protein
MTHADRQQRSAGDRQDEAAFRASAEQSAPLVPKRQLTRFGN